MPWPMRVAARERQCCEHHLRIHGPEQGPSAGPDLDRLHQADADPGKGHPRRHAGQGPAGHRPDRHRQDRRLRPADPASPGREPHPARAAHHARPDPEPHARTGDPDRRQFQGLWRPPGLPGRGDLRRREIRRPGARPATGSGHPGRRAGPPAGPYPAEDPGPVLDRNLRAGRGRPDAGPGLHQADPPDRQPDAGAPPGTCSSRPPCRPKSASWRANC